MPPSKPFHADPIDHPALSEGQRALSRRGVLRRFARGSVLIQEGDVGDTLYIILSGRLRAFSADTLNEREITYGIYGPGEYVGEMGLDGLPRSASVMALEAHGVLDGDAAHAGSAFWPSSPDFAFELLAKVIRRARAATLSAKGMALNDVYGRLKQLLETMRGAAARRHAAPDRAADPPGAGTPRGLLARDDHAPAQRPAAGRLRQHRPQRAGAAEAAAAALVAAPAQRPGLAGAAARGRRAEAAVGLGPPPGTPAAPSAAGTRCP
jgi:CRP/FNR family cyclic AMP-dependent transcriptional regulator